MKRDNIGSDLKELQKFKIHGALGKVSDTQ
jgi:hypothetical protein